MNKYISILAFWGTITTMIAQTPDSIKTGTLKVVEISSAKSENEKPVTLGKIAIKPMDLPQSVASIDREVMEQQQTMRLSDVLKNFNGVYIMGATGGYQEEIAGRGFAFNSNNTFKNGIRFNNAAMPELSALERVEIMKGSSAILFGNVAAGGVINLITKKPNYTTGGEITMTAGSYDFYKPMVDVYGTIDKNKHIAYRVNTSYEKARSFRDVVNAERTYINPSFLFQLGKKTELLIEGDYLKDNRTADFGVGAIDYQLIDVPRERFIGVNWSYIKTEQKGATASITHHINKNWDIKSVTAFQQFNSDLFSNVRPNSSSQFVKTDGKWIRGLQRTKIDETYGITQLDLTGKFKTWILKHTFLLGADADQYDTDNHSFNGITKYDSVNVFNLDLYKPRADIPDLTVKTTTGSPINRFGVYVQDLIEITRYVKLLAGVRFSYLETYSNVLTHSTGVTVKSVQFDNAFSPRLGLVIQPKPFLSLFGSYSNSFTPNTGVDINNNALPPSLIDQYEAGIKTDLFKGLFSGNITAYQIVNSNLAQTDLSAGNTNSSIKILAGEVTSQGLEVDLSSKPLKGLSVLAGYSFNETKYTKSNTFIEGSLLRYNPKHTANLSIHYNFSQQTVLNGLSIGLSSLYFGERYAGRSTRIAVPNDTYKLIRLPEYLQLDASLGYVKEKFSIRFKVSNITDVLSYNVHDDNSVNPIAPRQFSTTIGFKF